GARVRPLLSGRRPRGAPRRRDGPGSLDLPGHRPGPRGADLGGVSARRRQHLPFHPTARRSRRDRPITPRHPGGIRMKQATILVVDDEPRIVRLVRSNLEPAGYKVLTAADGEQGLRMAEMHDPDLIVLDIMMPGMDG